MGKGATASPSSSTAATLEIPDPLDERSADAGPLAAAPNTGGVDDLLAQMAGEEIDRLLAEADAAREEAGAASSPPPEPPALDKDVAAELDDPSLTLGVREAAGASVAAEVITGSGVELELATSPEERSALELDTALQDTASLEPAPIQIDASIFEDETEAASERPSTAVAEAESDGSLPIYLKPLEWINAPLAALSDRVRELLGKVALLTFFNAVAVLLYVMIFRKHH